MSNNTDNSGYVALKRTKKKVLFIRAKFSTSERDAFFVINEDLYAAKIFKSESNAWYAIAKQRRGDKLPDGTWRPLEDYSVVYHSNMVGIMDKICSSKGVNKVELFMEQFKEEDFKNPFITPDDEEEFNNEIMNEDDIKKWL